MTLGACDGGVRPEMEWYECEPAHKYKPHIISHHKTFTFTSKASACNNLGQLRPSQKHVLEKNQKNSDFHIKEK